MPVDRLPKSECSGCNACGDICPTKAISFKIDIEGFWYPVVNEDTCINCELCTRICPDINIAKLKKNDFKEPKHAIAAVSRNMYERWNSTSGGAFSAFAHYIYEQGGAVGGAVYADDFHVENFISDNPEDLDRLRSSKYLESYAEGYYTKVKEYLEKGVKVLVCGTPCQMTALRSFLRKDYENLIIVDFICRGVNSPKVYRKYLDSLEASHGSQIVKIKAKSKELGWRNLTRKVTFADGQVYNGVLMEDDFRRGYHTNVYCRPSCYECVFKGFPRISDITIGDFWGIENYAPNLDNNAGTSLILLNSEKGKKYFEDVKSRFEYVELPLNAAFGGNKALFTNIELAKIDRKEFFEDLDKGTFDDVVKKYFPPRKNTSLKRSGLRIFMSTIRKIKGIWGFDIKNWLRFYQINSRANTSSSFAEGRLIYPEPGTVTDIHPSAKINIEFPITLGFRPVKKLRLPGCLVMGKDSELNVLKGHRDRYGSAEAPYLLKNGCYIEIIRGGRLTIHNGAANIGLTIMCSQEITIGEGVRIGRNVSIRDWNGSHVIVSPSYHNSAPVHIGNRVWLCTGCSIMPGVNIGEGSVIGANSVVTRDIPPHSLAVGSPAKVIKLGIEWF